MKRFTIAGVAALALTIGFGGSASAAPGGDRTILFRSGADACYQIPAIVRTPAGTLIAAAEQRFGYNRERAARFEVGSTIGASGGGDPKGCGDSGWINIAYRRSTDGGRSWSPGQVVVAGSYFLNGGYKIAATENPTLAADGRSLILLFTVVRTRGTRNEPGCIAMKGDAAAKCGGVPAEYGIWETVSGDDGRHWQAPRAIDVGNDPKHIDRPGPGHGIVLPSGRVVVPTYDGLILSDNGGRTWRAGADSARGQLDGGESAVALLPDGTIWRSARPSSRSYRAEGGGAPIRVSSYSRDGGQTYASVDADRRFPMPPISAGMLSWQGGLFVSYPFSRQPSDGGVDMTQRRRLTITQSRDGGRSWTSCLIDPGSVAYSDMAGIDGSSIGLVYSGGASGTGSDPRGFQQAVVFRRVPVAALDHCAPPA